MVNQTSCTKSMFDFVHIHIVHTYPQSFPPKLSTSIFIGFSAFSSYTPTYPHYPHILPCSFLHPFYIFLSFLFCIYHAPRSVYTYFKSSGKRAKAVWYRGFETHPDSHSTGSFRLVPRFASHEFHPRDKAPRRSHG